MNSWEKVITMQFEGYIQSRISSIYANSENMRVIDQHVPQF
jgi:hypothetical protein